LPDLSLTLTEVARLGFRPKCEVRANGEMVCLSA
jgi:hypothetical protein